MIAKLHWVTLFGARWPVMAKSKQAARHVILQKCRSEAVVEVASAADLYQAGKDGIQILGVDDGPGVESGSDDSDAEADEAENVDSSVTEESVSDGSRRHRRRIRRS